MTDRIKHWYEFASDTFIKLVNINQRFIDGGMIAKKEILLAIGRNPVLIGGKLQITPHPWLIPLQEAAGKISNQLEDIRNGPQQIQNASKEALRIQWCG